MADAGWGSWGAPPPSSATTSTAHASAASSSGGGGGIGWDDDPAPNVGQNTQASTPAIPTPASNNGWITSADAVKPTASILTSTNNNNVNNNYAIPPPTSVPPSTILPESRGWVAPPPSFQASNPSNGGGAMDGNTSNANGQSSSSSSSWGNGGGGGNNAFGQERRAPPVYVFTIPNECKGYVIGSGGANLHRIQEETSLRVTQGRPKADSADPSERDFLIFNDENLPNEKAELALIRVVTLVRKKLRDWLPSEGKAAEDARKLLREGKFEDSNNGGYGSRNGNGNSFGNAYNGNMQNGPLSNGYGSQGGSWEQAIGNASNANAAPSSPIDTFPTQGGPFKDPNSPVVIPSNWGGLPPPTFSPGPRSNFSHYPNGRAVAQHNSNMNNGTPSNSYERPSNSSTSQINDRLSSNTGMNQWKPTAPSFVPRTQAAQPVVNPNEPIMEFNTFMKGSAGSQWASENLPPSSTTSSPQQVTAPQSLQQPTVNTSGGSLVGNGASYQDSAASAAALGWKVVKPAGSIIATSANDIVPPVIPPPPAFDAPSNLPARETTPRPGAQQQQQQNGWSDQAPSSQASAFNNGPSAGHQGYSAASVSPHERNSTHDSGFSQTHGVSTSQVGSNINGWTVKSVPAQNEADPIAPLSAAMSTMQVNGTSSGWNTSSNAQPGQDPASSSSGGMGWGDEPSSASISAVEIQPVATQSSGEGGIGWDDEPSSNSQAAKPQTGSWELPNASNGPSQQNGNNGYSSSKSSTFEDATETIRPSDSISNVNGDSRSVANGYSNGYGNQSHGNGYGNESHGNGYSNGQLNGYGNHQPISNGSNGYNSNSHSNNNANGSYGGNGGFSSNFNASGDDGYNSGSGGYSSGGGGGFGGAGSYGGGGPTQERRFPGPGGSWASGANEVPLRQNRWTLHANRRPGDDIHRPVVPQAIPGSGW